MTAAETDSPEPRFVAPGMRAGDELVFENVNSPKIMSPWEMRCHLAFVREQAGSDTEVMRVIERLDRFVDAWAAAWARFGDRDNGLPVYSQLLQDVRADTAALGAERLELPNELILNRVLEELIFVVAIGRSASQEPQAAGAPSHPSQRASSFRDRFDRPIFIVSTPRSGS